MVTGVSSELRGSLSKKLQSLSTTIRILDRSPGNRFPPLKLYPIEPDASTHTTKFVPGNTCCGLSKRLSPALTVTATIAVFSCVL
jgi:hypothetical protein